MWSKHVAWYNYQTNKGVLTEWFYTKLLQHIGMNNYKKKILFYNQNYYHYIPRNNAILQENYNMVLFTSTQQLES